MTSPFYLADPFRPLFHFSSPGRLASPGDPNGCFYAYGRHHLMYLYHSEHNGYCWGHLSSSNLISWHHHPDALQKTTLDDGCYSGGAFVDADGCAYLSFWIYNAERENTPAFHTGICIARATPPLYETWERLSPCVIPSKEWGVAYLNGNPIACADPSNIWKFNGLYHLQAGNLLLLNQYGRQLNSPEDMRGDWTEHFTSVDLLHWEYQGRFYQRNRSNEWTQPDEDAMCACFLPLPTSSEGSEASCVWLQLFLSHNRGCQYYLGYYDGTYFTPSSHGRMTYTDSSFFAPEAWLDVHGRQLMLCWMKDNPVNDFARFGWSGVFSLPRTLWLSNGKLCMRPVPELHALRGIHTVYASDILSEKSVILMVNTPFACELHFIILPGQNRSLSLTIAGEYATNQYACASINTQKNLLSFETTWRQGVLLPCEHAPLIIDDKDEINVTVYIDRSILEIFANDSQALCRRFYPPVDLKPILSISGQGNISLMESWLMNPLGTE